MRAKKLVESVDLNKQKIEDLLNDARNLIHEAEEIADKHGLEFRWSLKYGMGGVYKPRRFKVYTKPELLYMIQNGSFASLTIEEKAEAVKVLSDEQYTFSSKYDYEEGNWIASSENC